MKSFHKEQLGKVRTKIVATVGPASTDPLVMRQMVEAGVDVFRLNFSHGTHEVHTAALEAIRRVAAETETQLAVLQDLCGPKIRLGEIVGGVVDCDHDAEFVLVTERVEENDPHCLTSTYRTLADDLDVGQSVLFADGTVAMDVVARGPGWARLKVTLPGHIRSNQGINVPRTGLSVGGAHRQRSGRSRLDRDARGRLRRALVRAEGGGHRDVARRARSAAAAAPGSSPRSRSLRPSPISMRSSPRPTP